VALADDALEQTLARLDAPALPSMQAIAGAPDAPEQLPRFVKRYIFRPWRRVAPRVSLRPIDLPEPSPTRVFLLRSAPGTRLLQHDHTGLEMTCILSGAFVHEGGRFGPGDFDFGDPSIAHEPRVEPGDDCICLVAMQGDLKLRGLLGRLLQPFVRL
jgi:putative transcriptional regulator